MTAPDSNRLYSHPIPKKKRELTGLVVIMIRDLVAVTSAPYITIVSLPLHDIRLSKIEIANLFLDLRFFVQSLSHFSDETLVKTNCVCKLVISACFIAAISQVFSTSLN